MKHMKRSFSVGFVCLLFAGMAQAQESVSTAPELSTPRWVQFSGVVKDGLGSPRGGVVGLTFALYPEQEGGSALWLETQNVTADEQGRYTVLLGSTSSEGLPLELFATGEARWLGVQVNLPGETEQPRVLLVSVPYALKAADAETLGGQPLSAFVMATEQVTARVQKSGGLADPAVSDGITTAAVAGTGTTNKVVKWTDGLNGTLGDSSIFDNGNVGIGTSSPSSKLDVFGSPSFPAFSFRWSGYSGNTFGTIFSPSITTDTVGRISTYSGAGFAFSGFGNTAGTFPGLTLAGYAVNTSPTAPGILITGFKPNGDNNRQPMAGTDKVMLVQTGIDGTWNTGILTALANGNVGIGITNPTQKLDVNGTVKATAFSGSGSGLTGIAGTTSSTTNGASGVVGNATGASGQIYGVQGNTSSTTNFSAGVFGNTNGGETYGVSGNTNSTTNFTAGVQGYSSGLTGQTRGVMGTVNSTTNNAAGVVGSAIGLSGQTRGVIGTTSSNSNNAVGVFGMANGGSGQLRGVWGQTNSTTDFANGVRGEATGSSGSTRGVFGSTNSTTNGATGVVGSANGASGQTRGVQGNTGSTTDGAVGVLGGAQGASGQTSGVAGNNNSTTDFAAGVSGGANGTAGRTYGVAGFTNSTTDFAAGVQGNALGATGNIWGVHGTSNSTGNGATGVRGSAFGATGETYGVRGDTNSTTDNASGVSGEANGATGWTFGVEGQTNSSTDNSAGVLGVSSESGNTIGVLGASLSSSSTAGVFVDFSNGAGKILSGRTGTFDVDGNPVLPFPEVFRVEGDGDVVANTGDFQALGAGKGIILKSPNGTVCKRLSIDDSGTLVTNTVTCP